MGSQVKKGKGDERRGDSDGNGAVTTINLSNHGERYWGSGNGEGILQTAHYQHSSTVKFDETVGKNVEAGVTKKGKEGSSSAVGWQTSDVYVSSTVLPNSREYVKGKH